MSEDRLLTDEECHQIWKQLYTKNRGVYGQSEASKEICQAQDAKTAKLVRVETAKKIFEAIGDSSSFSADFQAVKEAYGV